MKNKYLLLVILTSFLSILGFELVKASGALARITCLISNGESTCESPTNDIQINDVTENTPSPNIQIETNSNTPEVQGTQAPQPTQTIAPTQQPQNSQPSSCREVCTQVCN